MRRFVCSAFRRIRRGIYGESTQLYDPIPSVFKRYNIIYIHIPKAAGSTINDTLFGFGHGHRTMASYTKRDSEFAQKAFKFSFVRHPYTRFVSAYHYLSQGGKNDHDVQIRDAHPEAFRTIQSFAEASEEPAFRRSIIHLRDQTDFLTLKESDQYYLHMDYVGKIEFLDLHIDILCPLLPSDLQTRFLTVKSKRLNVGKNRPAEIDRGVFDRIRRIYRVDFEVFGYDEWGTPDLTAALMAQQYQQPT